LEKLKEYAHVGALKNPQKNKFGGVCGYWETKDFEKGPSIHTWKNLDSIFQKQRCVWEEK
jgi:hypothetical protein